MKRQSDELQSKKTKISLDLDKRLQSSYNGYVPPEIETKIETVVVPTTEEEKEHFFQEYVVPRRPCKIDGVPEDLSFLKRLKPSKILDLLPSEEILTIEKKNEGGFGSGARRLKMSFGQFLDKLLDEGDTSLYLTTQYLEDDPNNGEYSTDEEEKDQVLDDELETGSITFENLHDDFDDLEDGNDDNDVDEGDDLEEQEIRVQELYQPPMTNCLDTVPETPKFLDYMIPQQINLWIGAAKTQTDDSEDGNWLARFDPGDPKGKLGLGRNVPGGGSSSGLHHDHADNLYIPVAGHKRFTLFAPCDAAKMFTVGTIRRLFSSGVIDYVNNEQAPFWRQLRDDGAIIAEVYKAALDANPSMEEAQKKEYEEFIQLDVEMQLRSKGSESKHLDPPSFATVPPSVVHSRDIKDEELRKSITKAAEKLWPSFFRAHRITVDLKPGEMLYLPAGWFHEVTSYGDNDSSDKNVHVAANYWFVPPTGHQIGNVYLDEYWPADYAITRRALEDLRSRNLE